MSSGTYNPGYTFLEKSKGNVQYLYDGPQTGGSWDKKIATQPTRQIVGSSKKPRWLITWVIHRHVRLWLGLGREALLLRKHSDRLIRQSAQRLRNMFWALTVKCIHIGWAGRPRACLTYHAKRKTKHEEHFVGLSLPGTFHVMAVFLMYLNDNLTMGICSLRVE